MSENKWAERELKRLGEETRILHGRVNEVTKIVGNLNTALTKEIAKIGQKLDDLIKANGKGVAVTKGQLLLAVAVISGLFGVIQTMIAVWK